MRKLAVGLSLALVASFAVLPTAATATKAAGKVVRCKGKRATEVGSKKKNIVIGTRGRDIIAARGGNDIIWAKGGRDLICAGKGADIIDGMKGRDKVYGGGGIDQCFGGKREHRYHFGCEEHLPSAQQPPPPNGKPASKVRSIASSAALAPAANSGTPECGQGFYKGYIKHNLSVATDSAHPLVATRPNYWRYTDQGWQGPSLAPWTFWNVPTDGNFYQIPFDKGELDHGNWVVIYQIYWGDNSGYDLYGEYRPSSYFVDNFGGIKSEFCFTHTPYGLV